MNIKRGSHQRETSRSNGAFNRRCTRPAWQSWWHRNRCEHQSTVARLPTVDASGRLSRTAKLARLESALLVADGPLSPRRLAQLAVLVDANEVRDLIAILNESYDRSDSAFRIEQVAAGLQLLTRAELAPWLDRLHQRPARESLPTSALETLTIIAYRQPITRADVEAIRGVQSAEMIRQLIQRGLVRVAGEDDSLGRPFLYGTTRGFLEHFGLRQLSDLPNYDGLRRQLPQDEIILSEDAEQHEDIDADEVVQDDDETPDVEAESDESLAEPVDDEVDEVTAVADDDLDEDGEEFAADEFDADADDEYEDDDLVDELANDLDEEFVDEWDEDGDEDDWQEDFADEDEDLNSDRSAA